MGSTIKVNTIQDAGGNSLLVSDGSGNITTNNIPSFGTAWRWFNCSIYNKFRKSGCKCKQQ